MAEVFEHSLFDKHPPTYIHTQIHTHLQLQHICKCVMPCVCVYEAVLCFCAFLNHIKLDH